MPSKIYTIPHEEVTVNYKCCQCGAIVSFPLAKSPGRACFVCDECDIPENYPEVVSISITKHASMQIFQRCQGVI